MEITQVKNEIEEFMNYGMQYIVWSYYWNNTFLREELQAHFFRNKQEAIKFQAELIKQII